MPPRTRGTWVPEDAYTASGNDDKVIIDPSAYYNDQDKTRASNESIARGGWKTQKEIAAMNNKTQRYGYDTQDKISQREDLTRRYGIDIGHEDTRYVAGLEHEDRQAATAQQRYATDIGSQDFRYGVDVGSADKRYGIESDLRLGEDQLATQRRIAQGERRTQKFIAEGNWAVDREKIAADLTIAREQIAFQREEMIKIGIPTMEANIRYQEAQVRLGEQAQKLAEARLGFDYISFASTLSGPQNWMQAMNFARNVQGNPEVAGFIDALNKNTGMAGFSGYSGSPDPLTAQSIGQKLQGQGQGGGLNDPNSPENQTIAAAKSVLDQGPTGMAPGMLENMDENELAMLGSIGGGLGFDMPRWLRDYQRGRIGTESAALA